MSAISNDEYQERYLKHQQIKKKSLTSNFGEENYKKYSSLEASTVMNVMMTRRSQRNFNNEDIGQIEMINISAAIKSAPSSCDRKAIEAIFIKERDEKELLSGILVGGVGWINRANVIILLFANMDAYKAPGEEKFMPYLDAGFVAQSVYMASEASNIGCCYVNPNIREDNKKIMEERFSNNLFCGACALGKYDRKAVK